MMERVEIIHDKPQEAMKVIRDVAKWGRDNGLRVWPEEWLTDDELLTEEAKPYNFCIGLVNGEIACGFILQNSDREYWEDDTEEKAVYLHKFCVRREFSHKEMTKSVVEALKTECKINGIKYIRLDTGLNEKVVRKIYLKAGFKIVDIIDYDNGNSMALYEMEV